MKTITVTKHLAFILGAWLISHASVQAIEKNPTIKGKVVVYTTLNVQSVETAVDMADHYFPNLKVDSINGGSSQLLKRIESEGAPAKADIFWSSSANVMAGYRPLFEPYQSPEAKMIPEALKAPDHTWVASNIHLIVLMVNQKQITGEMPRTWTDLAKPEFKGKIIVSDPGNSSTAYTALWGVEKNLGPELLKKIAQHVVVTSSASDVVRSVGQGEYAIGITFESTAYPYVAGGQKEIQLVYPSEGTFMVADNMAIIKHAPTMANAQAMYDLLLSKEAQIALLQHAYRRPSRTDIKVADYLAMPDLTSINILPSFEDAAAQDQPAFLTRWKGYLK